jgi:hypothetical protein
MPQKPTGGLPSRIQTTEDLFFARSRTLTVSDGGLHLVHLPKTQPNNALAVWSDALIPDFPKRVSRFGSTS